MKEYVQCFADSIDNPDTDWVVLVDRPDPHWRSGRLNLPGGDVKPGETVIDAACRELYDETGLVAENDVCEILGTVYGDDWVSTVVRCRFKGPYKFVGDGYSWPLIVPLAMALCRGSRIQPELRTIIPLCIAEQPWQMLLNEEPAGYNGCDYVLKIKDF